MNSQFPANRLTSLKGNKNGTQTKGGGNQKERIVFQAIHFQGA